jgi:GMP synthase-like glutamine amidotransferase
MNLHYFQHVPYEALGYIETWAKERGHLITNTEFHLRGTIPDIDSVDWLIVMGGPMSVHDETNYPWLVDEKRFIERAISRGKNVLGICLGAQLIANVLGARVAPMSYKEIGWYAIRKTNAADSTFFSRMMPAKMDVFHWHGDMFDTPDGAIHIASSEACINQGFVYQDRVVGLQFHPEMTPTVAREIIRHATVRLGEGRWVQSKEEMIGDSARFDTGNELMARILDELASAA